MRMLATLLILVLFVTSCSSGTGVSLAELAGINTVTLSTNASGSSYNSAQVTAGSNYVGLTPLYQTLYDFNSLSDQGWNSVMTLAGGGFTSGPTFSAGNFAYVSDSNGWHGMANLTSALLSDYVMVAEFTPNVLGALNLMGSCMRAQANLADHYMFAMWSGSYNIYKYNSGAFTGLVTTGGFVPTAGTTYMIKTYAVANSLQLKIWQKGTAEPGAWGASVLDATYASGYPCVDMYSQQDANYDNIRIGSSTYTQDFVTSNPTFTFAAGDLSGRQIESVTATVTASGSDAVGFDVSLDGGVTFKAWNGSSWAVNSSGYAGSMTLATFSSHASSLPAADTIIVRVYLHSALGYSTPTVSDIVLNL